MTPNRLTAAFAVLVLVFLPLGYLLQKSYSLGLLDGFFTGTPTDPPLPAAPAVPGGSGNCPDCHDTVGDLQRRGPHRVLTCQECHGLQSLHSEDGETPPAPRPTRNTVQLCSRCHRELNKKSGRAPQVNLEAHVVEVGALFAEDVCFDCHDPHDPR